jgi:hypothetical protein
MPAKTRPQRNTNQLIEATESEDHDELMELGPDEYKVDRILYERQTPPGVEYLIKWQVAFL